MVMWLSIVFFLKMNKKDSKAKWLSRKISGADVKCEVNVAHCTEKLYYFEALFQESFNLKIYFNQEHLSSSNIIELAVASYD